MSSLSIHNNKLSSRRHEQLSLRSQQHKVATVEESVLRTEMTGLESQEEDSPKCILFFKPMSWLGQIRPHRRDEAWSASLCQTLNRGSATSFLRLLLYTLRLI